MDDALAYTQARADACFLIVVLFTALARPGVVFLQPACRPGACQWETTGMHGFYALNFNSCF